jgi:ParB family transcriptional regulator, chromosome partitioning protein
MDPKEIQDIPIDSIRPSKFSLRPIDEKVMEELMQSIQAQGLLQPIMVRPLSEDSWGLIFGNHRLEACKRLVWKTIPCRVCDMDDAKSFMTAEVENLQKNNFIDPVQEARGFKMLREKKGLTESEIGKGIGKTQQYVSSRSGMLRLEPEIQGLITSRLVSAEHGYELSKIEDSKKRTILAELSRKDREDSLNLNEVREMAKLTIEELSKDARVDAILLRDPAERIRRMEARVMKLENEAHLFVDINLLSFVKGLANNGIWKRDHCDHYKGDICENWLWDHEVTAWKMKRDGSGWRLSVSSNPEYCATCPAYKEKASQPTK